MRVRKYPLVTDPKLTSGSKRGFTGGGNPIARQRKYAADHRSKSYGCVRITAKISWE